MYRRVIARISHWHEHAIHQRISMILGFDTWSIGTTRVMRDREPWDDIDLTLDFPTREDYERCALVIREICNINPVGTIYEQQQ